MPIENRLLHRPEPGVLSFYPHPLGQIAVLALGIAMIAVAPVLLASHGHSGPDPIDRPLALFGIVFGLYLLGLSGPQRLTVHTGDRSYRYADYLKLPLSRFANSVSPPRVPFLLAPRQGNLDADAQGVALREAKGNKRDSVHCWVLLIWKDETRLPVVIAFTRKPEDAQPLLAETAAFLGLPILDHTSSR
ncbi:MAG: hypothetical protein ABIY70_14945 [Capsulimonas sp.]|uniref:hypothetical protein n=1 Tax=Capsulimonas sp. TaxID=2494211 RepID=UPI0032647D27